MENAPEKPDGFSFRDVAILIEDFRGQFRAFGEGLDFLTRRFTGLEGKVDDLDKKIEDVRTNQAWTLEKMTRMEVSLDKKITILEISMNNGFKAVDKRFDSVENRIDGIESSRA